VASILADDLADLEVTADFPQRIVQSQPTLGGAHGAIQVGLTLRNSYETVIYWPGALGRSTLQSASVYIRQS
jgi:hypothetical protein